MTPRHAAIHDRADRIQRYIIYGMQVSLTLAAIVSAATLRWTVLFATLAVLATTFLPLIFERRYHIDLPVEYELVIIAFLYGTLFLGELRGYYTKFWWWDVLLHTSSAVAFGFIGFLVLYILDKQGKIKASPVWISIYACSFAIAIGAVWEIFEFGMDQLFGMNMQKSGLVDTMWDLIVDTLGAMLAATAGYFYFRSEKGTLISRLIRKFLMENPEFGNS